MLSFLKNVERVDVVFDKYLIDSLKQCTRQKRGAGSKLKVTASTNMPKQWSNFLHDDSNKVQLFKLLAERLNAVDINCKSIVVTHGDSVIVSGQAISQTSDLQPCTHEEADGRLLLHTMNASLNGHKRVTINTADTDVVIIAIHIFVKMNIDELWICFSTGKHKRFLPVHEYSLSLGSEKCQALLFWFAFTGCDTVSCFYGRGKKTAWYTLIAYPDVLPVFASLSYYPQDMDQYAQIIERYTVLLYDRTSSCKSVNECRKMLFTKKNRSIDNIPPTAAALLQHSRRACYQAGTWAKCLQKIQNLPNPCQWGWDRQAVSSSYIPQWTLLAEASKHCRELIHCGCQKLCNNNCKCIKAALVCTDLCRCDAQCPNV